MARGDWNTRDWDAGDWDGDAYEWPEGSTPVDSDDIEPGSGSGHVSFDGGAIAARVVAVFAGLFAVGLTSWYWGGNTDLCAGTAGWWFIAVVLSPLVFVALVMVCVAVVPSDAERLVWIFIMAATWLVYLPSLFVTIVGGGMAQASC